ncbi:MAG: adenine deaminase [Bacteroidetes bacterium GWF2_43_63]|nr:MAG: adenine deaminase [Bacteroidetes bacterium GWE2_42_42]OFY55149.1 MAG: adenine deaminase [Bacteroidetes bacterium GWF2_43_63]HBG70231.1 adenine deaminase [Bacteroidales bacterium]HCB63097.1 adenine deaminase [Bacteroidales bacterium]HCY22684.1 adenine deaminase [Bacteroidales bacterium]
MTISGQIIDIRNRRIFAGEVVVENGKIAAINELETAPEQFILPGFIDAHVHIESSMLAPSRFAELAVKQGTVATVSDPHEIANVLGVEGVKFMIENGKSVPFNFFFGAPSCVPATPFETAGFSINAAQTAELMRNPDIWYLGEMMNFPGVIFDDPEVHAKIKAALDAGKPVDGHAPMLSGEQLIKYAKAGISTDHECTNIEEAEEKIKLGMKILIREGSAARDFDMLYTLIDKYPNDVMLCTDDCHPDELMRGHINVKVKNAIERGMDLFNVLQVACVNPVQHYHLPVGTLNTGDNADFIVIGSWRDMDVQQVYIKGEKVYNEGEVLIESKAFTPINNFSRQAVSASDFVVEAKGENIKVIIAKDGELLTESAVVKAKLEAGNIVSDVEEDILKITVLNRYDNSKPAIGFIKGIGIQRGALACSVAHDSHNLIAVGTDDEMLAAALNKIIASKGGLAAVDAISSEHLALPLAGLMSDRKGEEVAAYYHALNQKAAEMGSPLRAPFMTLAFMALLVIPKLKLSDKGLFDGTAFSFTELFV